MISNIIDLIILISSAIFAIIAGYRQDWLIFFTEILLIITVMVNIKIKIRDNNMKIRDNEIKQQKRNDKNDKN